MNSDLTNHESNSQNSPHEARPLSSISDTLAINPRRRNDEGNSIDTGSDHINTSSIEKSQSPSHILRTHVNILPDRNRNRDYSLGETIDDLLSRPHSLQYNTFAGPDLSTEANPGLCSRCPGGVIPPSSPSSPSHPPAPCDCCLDPKSPFPGLGFSLDPLNRSNDAFDGNNQSGENRNHMSTSHRRSESNHFSNANRPTVTPQSPCSCQGNCGGCGLGSTREQFLDLCLSLSEARYALRTVMLYASPYVDARGGVAARRHLTCGEAVMTSSQLNMVKRLVETDIHHEIAQISPSHNEQRNSPRSLNEREVIQMYASSSHTMLDVHEATQAIKKVTEYAYGDVNCPPLPSLPITVMSGLPRPVGTSLWRRYLRHYLAKSRRLREAQTRQQLHPQISSSPISSSLSSMSSMSSLPSQTHPIPLFKSRKEHEHDNNDNNDNNDDESIHDNLSRDEHAPLISHTSRITRNTTSTSTSTPASTSMSSSPSLSGASLYVWEKKDTVSSPTIQSATPSSMSSTVSLGVDDTHRPWWGYLIPCSGTFFSLSPPRQWVWMTSLLAAFLAGAELSLLFFTLLASLKTLPFPLLLSFPGLTAISTANGVGGTVFGLKGFFVAGLFSPLPLLAALFLGVALGTLVSPYSLHPGRRAGLFLAVGLLVLSSTLSILIASGSISFLSSSFVTFLNYVTGGNYQGQESNPFAVPGVLSPLHPLILFTKLLAGMGAALSLQTANTWCGEYLPAITRGVVGASLHSTAALGSLFSFSLSGLVFLLTRLLGGEGTTEKHYLSLYNNTSSSSLDGNTVVEAALDAFNALPPTFTSIVEKEKPASFLLYCGFFLHRLSSWVVFAPFFLSFALSIFLLYRIGSSRSIHESPLSRALTRICVEEDAEEAEERQGENQVASGWPTDNRNCDENDESDVNNMSRDREQSSPERNNNIPESLPSHPNTPLFESLFMLIGQKWGLRPHPLSVLDATKMSLSVNNMSNFAITAAMRARSVVELVDIIPMQNLLAARSEASFSLSLLAAYASDEQAVMASPVTTPIVSPTASPVTSPSPTSTTSGTSPTVVTTMTRREQWPSDPLALMDLARCFPFAVGSSYILPVLVSLAPATALAWSLPLSFLLRSPLPILASLLGLVSGSFFLTLLSERSTSPPITMASLDNASLLKANPQHHSPEEENDKTIIVLRPVLNPSLETSPSPSSSFWASLFTVPSLPSLPTPTFALLSAALVSSFAVLTLAWASSTITTSVSLSGAQVRSLTTIVASWIVVPVLFGLFFAVGAQGGVAILGASSLASTICITTLPPRLSLPLFPASTSATALALVTYFLGWYFAAVEQTSVALSFSSNASSFSSVPFTSFGSGIMNQSSALLRVIRGADAAPLLVLAALCSLAPFLWFAITRKLRENEQERERVRVY